MAEAPVPPAIDHARVPRTQTGTTLEVQSVAGNSNAESAPGASKMAKGDPRRKGRVIEMSKPGAKIPKWTKAPNEQLPPSP